MNKRIFGIFCFLLLTISQLNAQNSFPEDWEGNYKGELQIFGVDSVRMKLTMKLDIFKKTDSVYQWKMTYDFKGKEDIRDYELHIKDVKKGHYIIDEKNTILIEGFYRSKIFTSFFSVSDSYIISSYTKIGNDLQFEIISGSSKNSLISGNQEFLGEQIPEVKSYLINGRQKAVLKRL